MLRSALPSPPLMPLSVKDSLVALIGPAPNVKATLIAALNGPTVDIEGHRLKLIAYRDKVVALMGLLERSLTTSDNKPMASARQTILAPKAA